MPDLDGYQVLRIFGIICWSRARYYAHRKVGVKTGSKGWRVTTHGQPFDPRELILRIGYGSETNNWPNRWIQQAFDDGNLLSIKRTSVTIGGEKQDFTLTEFNYFTTFSSARAGYRPGIIYFWVCGSSMRMWRPAPSMCTSAGYGRSLSNPPSRSKRSAVWAIVCLSN